MKTCALCKHCRIELGEEDWPGRPPGFMGSIACSKGHDVASVWEALALLGSECSDFELLEIG